MADDERDKLERNVEMLRYSIDNMEGQLTFYKEGELEWTYAKKILDSCREMLAQKEKELEELLKKEGRESKGGPENP